jgi:FdhD protein
VTARRHPTTWREPLAVERVLEAPDRLREHQRAFDKTGGLHAAGLLDADGELVCVREDVGRHNALDKVIGWALREGRLPLVGCTLVVSSRASYELTQKAVLAGAELLVAVSAPSSLAVELADEAGLTLVAFVRGETMNVYAHPERLDLANVGSVRVG